MSSPYNVCDGTPGKLAAGRHVTGGAPAVNGSREVRIDPGQRDAPSKPAPKLAVPADSAPLRRVFAAFLNVVRPPTAVATTISSDVDLIERDVRWPAAEQ